MTVIDATDRFRDRQKEVRRSRLKLELIQSCDPTAKFILEAGEWRGR